jgi:archaellum component FlaC
LELQQKKLSKAERVNLFCTKRFPLTEPFSEKYLKKLFGNTTDIEDALKRLDRLTQEEARMAAAQLLKVTNTIDNRVERIADNVLVVDNRVACVDDTVVGVDERVADIDDRVKDVDDKVKAVDDKLVAVIDGAQYIFN